MRYVVAIACVALGGCATSSAGLYQSKVEQTFTSNREPQAVATCVVEAFMGDNQIRNDGNHYWVVRFNGYGLPRMRWDFLPRQGGGTTVELRSSIDVNSGDEKVKACL